MGSHTIHPYPPPAEHPHLISQLSLHLLPYKTLMPDLEGKKGGEDWTQDSVPQGSHSCGSLRRNLGGGAGLSQASWCLFPTSEILLISSHLSLGSSNSEVPPAASTIPLWEM